MAHNAKVGSIGSFFIFTGALGILFTLSFVAITWIGRNSLIKGSQLLYATLETALVTTNEGLSLINTSLDQADQSVAFIGDAIDDLSASLSNLGPLINATATIIGEDMIFVIQDAQTSINSAASGSRLIDNTLTFLASIPLLGTDYRTEVPLHQSLEQLSTNLDNLPDNLLAIHDDLNQSVLDLEEISLNLSYLSADFLKFKSSISQSKIVITDYQSLILDLQTRLVKAQLKTPKWLTVFAIVTSSMLFWLMLLQISLILLGFDLIKDKINPDHPSDDLKGNLSVT